MNSYMIYIYIRNQRIQHQTPESIVPTRIQRRRGQDKDELKMKLMQFKWAEAD